MPHSPFAFGPPDDSVTVVTPPPTGDDDPTPLVPVRPFPTPPPARLPFVPGYVVSGELARGGMGRVLAAREVALGREVAVKVLLPGADAGRFVTEARITARLPHPNVPPVYALGTLPDGSPFLAMKRVRGRTLADELADGPPVADRLPRLVQVFEGICQAVGYAHAQGVIHRDLKPGNVMVGAFGEVQVMDWGLAKLLAAPDPGSGSDLTPADATATAAGFVMGTPQYMAPEQARGEPVNARADVFALGGILATVLTGRPPFDGSASDDVVARAGAADTAPVRARLAACGADAELVAVAADCLAADPAGRPADGRAVADRVAAYRAGVEGRLRRAEQDRAAAAATAAGEAKRRRVVRAAAGAVAAVLLAGTGVSVWQAGLARAEAAHARAAEGLADERAEKETAAHAEADRQWAEADLKNKSAVAAKEFLDRVLQQAGPAGQASKVRQARHDLTLREALDHAAKTIDGQFPGQPAIESDLRTTIGKAYHELGRYADAAPHAAAALRLREAAFGPHHPLTVRAICNLATIHQATGDLTAAEPLFRRGLAAAEAAWGADHRETYTAAHLLGHLLHTKGDAAAAEPLLRRALAGREGLLGPDHPSTLECVHTLGLLAAGRGDPAAAEPLFRRALAGREAAFGPAHPDTAKTAHELAGVLYARGQTAAAVPLFRQALDSWEVAYGPTHLTTLAGAQGLAAALQKQGDLAAAEPLVRRALEGLEVAYGPTHPTTLTSANNLAFVLSRRGDFAAAEPLARRAVEAAAGRQFRLKNDLLHLGHYVGCLRGLGRWTDAERWQRKLSAVVAERSGPESAEAAAELVQLGLVLVQQDKWVDAEEVLRRGLAVREKRAADPKPAVAAWQVANTRSLVGSALLGQRRFVDAEPLLLAGYEGLKADEKAVPAAGKANLPDAAGRLVALYARWGKPAEAAKWRAERAAYPPEQAPRPRPVK